MLVKQSCANCACKHSYMQTAYHCKHLGNFRVTLLSACIHYWMLCKIASCAEDWILMACRSMLKSTYNCVFWTMIKEAWMGRFGQWSGPAVACFLNLVIQKHVFKDAVACCHSLMELISERWNQSVGCNFTVVMHHGDLVFWLEHRRLLQCQLVR